MVLLLMVFYLFVICFYCFFFFNDTATTEIYTLSLHDALPIWCNAGSSKSDSIDAKRRSCTVPDRKSTRLNSSHTVISYAVFCLKKKKKNKITHFITKKKTHKKQIN